MYFFNTYVNTDKDSLGIVKNIHLLNYKPFTVAVITFVLAALFSGNDDIVYKSIR